MFSVIIPTYNERENIGELIYKIREVCSKNNYEIIVVDDNSPDRTWELIEKLMRKHKNIKLLKREKKSGVTSAVLDGVGKAKYKRICVMDADFSHDPIYIPQLIGATKNHDVIIGSRYVAGGKIKDWPVKRKIISYVATKLAKPLTNVEDPLSGYFAFKKNILKGISINEKAAKIALEILVKYRNKDVKEIPIVFSDRKYGKSTSMNIYTVFSYIKQLSNLYSFKLKRCLSTTIV